MSNFTWIAQEALLSESALTVLAQSYNMYDRDQLTWQTFFPRENVDSVDLEDLTAIDFRPVSDRREWDQRGRLIPVVTPNRRKVSIVPVESYFKYGEYEMQKLRERTLNNEGIMRQQMAITIPSRVEVLVRSNERRIEVEAMSSWANGSLVQRNPQNAAETVPFSWGFDSARYQTAGTAWSDNSLNAWEEFISWLKDAPFPVAGAKMRRATYNAISADAPIGINGFKLSGMREQEMRIQDVIGSDFTFVIDERAYDIFNDGGTAYTRTKVWTPNKIAAIPAGNTVGRTAFAPVSRAMELAAQVPGAGVDIRGNTVYYESGLMGRQLDIECQINPLTVPSEEYLHVINAGV